MVHMHGRDRQVHSTKTWCGTARKLVHVPLQCSIMTNTGMHTPEWDAQCEEQQR